MRDPDCPCLDNHIWLIDDYFQYTGECAFCYCCIKDGECTCTPHTIPGGYGFTTLHHPECAAY